MISACVGVLLINLGLISKGGRIRAKQVVCRSNAKYLNYAWLMFANDHDGQLVGGRAGGQSESWISSPASPTLQAQKDAVREGALFPYLWSTNMYRCPANTGHYQFCTYKIPGGANGGVSWEYIPATSYSELKRPATRYIFVEEIDPRGYAIGSWQMHVQSKTWVDPLLIWHNNRTTLGFADGHAVTHRWMNESLIKWCSKAVEDPARFNFNMTPPPDEREDIEYMANGFPYKSLK